MNLVIFKEQYLNRGFAYALTAEMYGEFAVEFPTLDQRDEFLATINILLKTEKHHRSQFFEILLTCKDFDYYETATRYGMRWLWYTNSREAEDAFKRLMWLTT